VVKRRHHGEDDPSPDGRIEDEELIARSVDRIVATCSDEVFELIRMGADRRKVSVIPCGVDLDHFTPAGPVEPRTPGRRRVLALARLVPRKGVDDAVEALVRLPDTELVVAGGPEPARLKGDAEAQRLMRLAAERGVADRVQVRGRVERSELPALIRSADVVTCVPWYEPFGIVPLEAMACGVPVVASAVGGQIDSVVDGVTGVHVPPRRPVRLAEALCELLADPRRRAALGAAGAHRARSRFGWDAIAAATLDAYRSHVARFGESRNHAGGREREAGAR
jgi:glycosyltransferase involved in cell wall biosynthesis